ncbi:MAG: hypothetical protein DRI84_08860 [Bacteroidetes bacterium]|nr:MAG: hypothetical protein DRI84_08860 [Bacteroidota bacterium]
MSNKKDTLKKDKKKKTDKKKVEVKKPEIKKEIIKQVEKVKKIEIKKPIKKPIAKKSKIIRCTSKESFILEISHVYCEKIGKCSCKMVDGKRIPKCLHIFPGIPFIIPEEVLKNKQIKKRRYSGCLLIHRQ